MKFRIQDHMDRDTFFRLVRIRKDETYENMKRATRYYLDVYDGKFRFNFAAAHFGGFWMLYRKMYWQTLVAFLAKFLFDAIVLIGILALMGKLIVLKLPNYAAVILLEGSFLFTELAVFLLLGYKGNSWYFKHLCKLHKKGKAHSGAWSKTMKCMIILLVMLIIFAVVFDPAQRLA